MMSKSGRFTGINWTIFLLIACFVFCFSTITEKNAFAKKKKSNILVTIKGASSVKTSVAVELSGGKLSSPLQKTTNNRGKATFKNVKRGVYTVTPVKSGVLFTPYSKTVKVTGKKKKVKTSIRAKQIPSVASLSVDNATTEMVQGDDEDVIVSVLDSDSKGIKGVSVSAQSANAGIVSVSPITDTTGADGNATFTLSGEAKGSTTITFASGAITATTVVTVTAQTQALLWAFSGHADSTAEAFNHWNSDGEISTSCAKCHSRDGFLDYIGKDGTDSEVVDNAAEIGTVVDCFTCHEGLSDVWDLDRVIFPSGDIITNTVDVGASAICMTCHQGRESGVSIENAIVGISDDVVSSTLGFKNIHYFAAGATLYGTEVNGGYEYSGKQYDGKFPHVDKANVCTECHDMHSLKVRVKLCLECHTEVGSEDELKDIRMVGSTSDYDGDGNTSEGVYYEIKTLMSTLLSAMQSYATNVSGTSIAYDESSYPYFFIDTNGNGIVDTAEASSANKYNAWTPRLLKAAYNYQVVKKDPGAFAHNAKYIIELLYDGIEDLASNDQVTVDMTGMVRNDSGHFDPTAEAFRHWDGDGEVSTSCTKCHASPGGFDYYVENLANPPDPLPVTWGMPCETCHTGKGFSEGNAPLKVVDAVVFPSAITVTNTANADPVSFICMTCHQGRESKKTIDDKIAASSFSFRNVHYLPAGAILYGSDAEVAYEYDGKVYNGKFTHTGGSSTQCDYCHEATAEGHSFEPTFNTSTCGVCHTEVTGGDIETIRLSRSTDYDGDGNATEELKDEIAGLQTALYTQIQSYATNTLGSSILYDGSTYPYFFIDTNGNGVADDGEVTYSNSYKAWDAKLMKAAHNYQISIKEPGAWAHNTKYMVQVMIDAIEDLDGTVSSYNRP